MEMREGKAVSSVQKKKSSPSPDSVRSDKAALLPNGHPPQHLDSLTVPKGGGKDDIFFSKKSLKYRLFKIIFLGGHSRQSSNTSTLHSNDSGHSSSNNNLFSVDIGNCQQGVVVALHRKMVPQEVYFLSMEKYRPVLFGLPLIIPCSEESTYQDLYKSVWTQVSRLVSPLPPRDSTYNHATDW